MPFRKWNSNCDAVLSELPREETLEYMLLKQEKPIDTWKMLGLKYLKDCDPFAVSIPKCEVPIPFTSRTVLSTVARLYDPTGNFFFLILDTSLHA